MTRHRHIVAAGAALGASLALPGAVARAEGAGEPARPVFPRPVLGAVYDIAEPDALAEIEAAAAGVSVGLEDFGDSDDWTATQSVALPRTTTPRLRDFPPLYTLDFDIPDDKGGILYPAGFTFNPLEHVQLPNELWVVGPEDLDWALDAAGPYDMVLLSGGNALKESQERRRPVYLLEARLAERLGLHYVPSRVRQAGTVFQIWEFLPPAAASADDAASLSAATAVEASETSFAFPEDLEASSVSSVSPSPDGGGR